MKIDTPTEADLTALLLTVDGKGKDVKAGALRQLLDNAYQRGWDKCIAEVEEETRQAEIERDLST